jgi:hypothetical protein
MLGGNDGNAQGGSARSARSPKLLVAFGKKVLIGLLLSTPWYEQRLILAALKTVLEHGSVNLLENVLPHFNSEARVDAENVSIVRSVMELAEREPV